MYNLIKTILLSFLFVLFTQGTTKPPNIVVILVDDMGFSDIGVYGSEIPTPNIDRLAREGVRFSQFYNAARCCPTRASLLTGLYPHQAGMGHMIQRKEGFPGYYGTLNDSCVTIAELLKQQGYFTCQTGKWHLGDREITTPEIATPMNRGFDRSLSPKSKAIHYSNQVKPGLEYSMYLDDKEYSLDDPILNPPWYGSDLYTEQGIRFIDEAILKKQPFFFYLAYTAPHFPLMAPEATIAKYRGKYMEGWDKLREKRYQRQLESGLVQSSNCQLAPRPSKIPAWDSLSQDDKERYDHMMAIYAAMVDEIDKNIGKLTEALEKRGELDNTLILLMSDNGSTAEGGISGKYEGERSGRGDSYVFVGECWAYLNNTPFRKYKRYTHEGGIASPFIAYWPNKIKTTNTAKPWVHAPAHLIDVMATCVEASGATYPKEFKGKPIIPMEGQSLMPLFTGKDKGELNNRILFWEHENNTAIRSGNLKLVRSERGQWELYDLSRDRSEVNNLAEAQKQTVATLERQWHEWAKRANVLPSPRQPKNK